MRRPVEGFLRRTSIAVAIIFGLTVAVPGMIEGPGKGFPVSWLWSWATARPAWTASAFIGRPVQARGAGLSRGHYVSAAQTAAAGGAGSPQEHVADGLKPYAPHDVSIKPGAAGRGVQGFQTGTSRSGGAGTDATTDVFANADGSVTQRIAGGRLNYRAGGGDWRSIETRLIKSADGRWHMAANDISVSFGDAPDAGFLSQATAGQISGAATQLASMRLPAGEVVGYDLVGAKHTTATVKDSTAWYADILPETDLELVAADSGVKETLVLKSAKAGNSWLFPLRLQGLTPRMAADGSVELVDRSGQVKVWLPRGNMQDSKVDPRHGGVAESTNLTYELISHEGAPALRVTADAAWLRDPARVFPVRVDPTATTATTGDAFVDADPAGPDHNGDNLPVGTWDGGGVTKTRSFIQLDNFAGNGFTGKRIVDAKLYLYLTWTQTCNVYRPFYVHAATQKWTVANLSTAAYPGPTIGPVIGSLDTKDYTVACTNTAGNRSVGRWVVVPLETATFQGWASGGANLGLALTASETDNNAWKRFTSANYSSGQYKPYLELTYTEPGAPQLDVRYPSNNHATPTLTPQLMARAHDPDASPNTGLDYKYQVWDETGRTLVAESAWGGPVWTVPAGELAWSETYLYTVQVYDHTKYSEVYPAYAFTTSVPQPQIGSRLADDDLDKGFDPSVGNYTTEATDAEVDTIGPDLELTRSYNSLDFRTRQGMGRGWSSLVDTVATEVRSVTGALQAVAVSYPDGQQAAFGREADGSFTPPQGRFAILGAGSGFYTLIDKDATVYRFAQSAGGGAYKISSVTDANGLALTFTYNGSHQLTQIRSASGRSLYLTWALPAGGNYAHVMTVRTDPVIPGNAASALTWQYTYDNDNLAKVCDPTNACTTYSYTWISQHANSVQDADPDSYWRLGDAPGAAMAGSSVQANSGVDNGVYNNVTLGQPSALDGSTSTSASFNGTSFVQLPGRLIADTPHQSISLWFKTTGSGVLAGTQSTVLTGMPAAWQPAIYVGTDGKLYGEFWTGSVGPMCSAGRVNDGLWHHAVLSADAASQSLYLDGTKVGTINRPLVTTPVEMTYGFLGAARWTHRPATTGDYGYYTGSIAEAAFFHRSLADPVVADLYNTGKWPRSALTKITRPSGGVSAAVTYDASTGKVATVTDEDGGVWTMRPTRIEGSSGVYVASVLGGRPVNYWRLADVPGDTDAVNEVRGGVATYNNTVTLGVAGPFADAKAASFNGATSAVTSPAPSLDTSANFSISAWVRLADGARHQKAVSVSGTLAPGVWLGYNADTGKWQAAMHRSDVDNAPSDGVSSLSAAALNTWTQLTVTHEVATRTLKLYVDGVPQETTTVGGTAWRAGGPLYIGRGLAADFWKGDLAEVATSGMVLSPAQVLANTDASKQSAPVAITKVAGGVSPIVMPVATVGVTDPDGKGITYSFDLINGYRIVAQTDALGNTTKFGYDAGGFSSLHYDPRGVLTEEIQDVRGNTIQSITCQDQAARRCSSVYFTYYPDATTSALAPDGRNDVMLSMRDGRSASATDNTYLTTYTYDTRGNRTEEIEPLGRKTTTTYNAQGLPTKVVSPGGAVDITEYNAAGDVVRTVDPLGKVITYAYDGIGRRITETETTSSFPNGMVTRFTYDGAGRLLTQTDPPVTDRVTGAIHTSVTTSVYDADGLETSHTISDTTGGDAPRTVSQGYNALGQKVSETDASGDVTRFEYDVYGRLRKEIEPDGDVVFNTHDAEGNMLSSKIDRWTGDPNQAAAPTDLVTASHAYDPAGRLASETDAMGYTTEYTYTDNGLLARIVSTDGATSFVVQENSYDGAGQLIRQVTDNGGTVNTYTYDAAGRQVSSTLDPGGLNRTTTKTYSLDDDVVTTTDTDGSGTIVGYAENMYDIEGNPIAETTYTSTGLSPVGRWKLADTKDASGNGTLKPTGNVGWSASPRTAAVFDGNAALTTAGPVLDTARSFTVTAWAYPTDASRNRSVVSQEARNENGFYLKLDDINGDKWSFVMYNYDDGASAHTYATSSSVAPMHAWTHLAAVYDGPAKQIRLYVNGSLQSTSNLDAGHVPWTSYGPLHIGRQKYHGAMTDPWAGQIGDVQAYQKALSATEIGQIQAGSAPAAGAGVNRQSRIRDTEGLVVADIDPMGETTDYALDEEGHHAITIGPAVTSETFGTAPVSGRPITTAGYNTFGEETETKDANGNITVTEYDASGQQTTVTGAAYTPPGSTTPIWPVTRTTYDSGGKATSVTDEQGFVHTMAYDQLGRLAKATAPNRAETRYTYDLADQVLSVVEPTGAVTSSTYDHLGRLLTSTEVVRQTGTSLTTTRTYDAQGNLAQIRSPGGVTTSFTYNAADQILTSTDGAGGVTRYTYDGGGRLVKKTLPDNTYTTSTYDLADRATSHSSYSAAGVLLKTESVVYNAAGKTVAAIDARGTATTFTYDATGLVTSERQPISATDAVVTTFGYDLMGHRTRFTDGRGNQFWSTYNKWNLPESYIEPATAAHPNPADRTFTTVYDADSKPVTQLLPGGVRIDTAYDNTGKPVRQTGSGAEAATVDRVFGYDEAGNMTSLSGSGGTNTIAYDDAGHVLSIAGPSGNSSFTYTPDGNLASRTDAAGTTNYTYDSAGRLKTVANAGTGVNATLTYNAASLIDRIVYGGDGNTRWIGYDPLHQVVSDELKTPAGTTVAKITYGWDANGNEISKSTTGFAGSATNTYAYDLADRLTSWNGTAYSYDKAGNRTANGGRTFRYDERNRLLDEGNGTVYGYTPRGTLRQTTIGSVAMATEADAYNQVTRQYAGAGSYRDYAYDGLGRVMRTGFAYTGLGNDLAADGDATYTREPDGDLVGVATATSRTLAWTDLHTDVVGQFTPTGAALSGSTAYDPLGKILATSGMLGNLGYQSEWTDALTGRVNMFSRWYNTNTGQFDTRDTADNDPVPDSINANRYQYADGNPLTVTDPDGHFGIKNIFKKVAKKVTKVVKKVVKKVVSKTVKIAKKTVSKAIKAVKKIVHTAKKVYKTAKKAVTKKAKSIGGAVKKAIKSVKKVARKTLNTVKKVVKKSVKAAKKHVGKAFSGIAKAVKKAVSRAKAIGKKVVAKAARRTTHGIRDLARSVGSFAKAAKKAVSKLARNTTRYAASHRGDIEDQIADHERLRQVELRMRRIDAGTNNQVAPKKEEKKKDGGCHGFWGCVGHGLKVGWDHSGGYVVHGTKAFGEMIGRNWRDIAKWGIGIGGGLAATVCVFATAGICAAPLTGYLLGAGIAAGTGAANYALTDTEHTAKGWVWNTVGPAAASGVTRYGNNGLTRAANTPGGWRNIFKWENWKHP